MQSTGTTTVESDAARVLETILTALVDGDPMRPIEIMRGVFIPANLALSTLLVAAEEVAEACQPQLGTEIAVAFVAAESELGLALVDFA